MLNLFKKLKRITRSGSREHDPDYVLIGTVGTILLFGLLMLSSASAAISYVKHGSSYYYFNHQLFGLFLGIFAFWFFARVDYHFWQKQAFWFLVFSIILLLLVFIPGLAAEYGNAKSWITIFGFSLQPSEFVKLSFLLYLAAWLEGRVKKLHDIYQGTGPFLAVLGFIAILMLLQPDMGTLSIVTITSLIVYFVAGGSKKHIIVIILVGILAFSSMISMREYQRNRIKCMVDSSFSPGDICYQVNQSLIAVGSGGFFGRGFGESRQKFQYLPEVSSDSIFAIIAEETGMFFSSILLGLYLLLFYRGVVIAKKAPDVYGRILAVGVVSWISIQAIINIGGIINIMPMTGVPLPLISLGGSAMLASLTAMGILVNISKQTRLR